MNNSYLDRAKKVIPDPQILSIVAAKRAKKLALGARPMIKCDSKNVLDVALLEIAEGLLTYTIGIEEAAAADAEEAAQAAAAKAAAEAEAAAKAEAAAEVESLEK